MSDQPINILIVSASGRIEGSVTRRLTEELLEEFKAAGRLLNIVRRDLAHGMPFVDQEWIGANFTPADKRTADQAATLSYSDSLVDELRAADLIVISSPVYNFSVPAALKAWIDQIARAGLTFRYTENGPVGLLENKKTIVINATGGTPIGSDIDFSTDYLRHVLGFVGLRDVSFIAADGLGSNAEAKLKEARDHLADYVSDYGQGARAAA